MTLMRPVAIAILVQCMMVGHMHASRINRQRVFSARIHDQNQVDGRLVKEDLVQDASDNRPTSAQLQEHQCPYGSKKDSETDGTIGFNCHRISPSRGATCPALQLQRFQIANKFFQKKYGELVRNALDFKLQPLFDKTAEIRFDESYEELDKYHIAGLNHQDCKFVEDKILYKDIARKSKIPTTTTYFQSHVADWGAGVAFKQRLEELCDRGINGFMIKAVHLAWSEGQKVVTGWQEKCKSEDKLDNYASLVQFVEEEVLAKKARASDSHLLNFVDPGVIVEELFYSGGHSTIPLEAKVVILWGKVVFMWIQGEDDRGCMLHPGSVQIFADRTGFDFRGAFDQASKPPSDPTTRRILKEAFGYMVMSAEKWAAVVGADMMRADFFIDLGKQPARVVMNEPESVSGNPYWYEREALGDIWRVGYRNRYLQTMSGNKWMEIINKATSDRNKYELDSAGE